MQSAAEMESFGPPEGWEERIFGPHRGAIGPSPQAPAPEKDSLETLHALIRVTAVALVIAIVWAILA